MEKQIKNLHKEGGEGEVQKSEITLIHTIPLEILEKLRKMQQEINNI